MKLPGAYYIYSLLMALFGKTSVGIHLGLLGINLLTVGLLYISTKKLFNNSIGFFTAAFYGLVSLSSNFPGSAAHATQFINLFLVLGLFFYTKLIVARNALNAFVIGLMLGICFIIKQHAVFFILFGFSALTGTLIYTRVQLKKRLFFWFSYISGAILPYLLILSMVSFAGNFEKFWLWTTEYAALYTSNLRLSEGKHAFNLAFKPMLLQYPVVWMLCLAGGIGLFDSSFSVLQKIFILGLGFFSLLTICPGLYSVLSILLHYCLQLQCLQQSAFSSSASG
jgi:4-amino-4-deoxy-L-arabinose transferase-like glycosyltransferase